MSTKQIQLIDPLGGARSLLVEGRPVVVEHNATTELPEVLANRLLKQSDIWREVQPQKQKRAAGSPQLPPLDAESDGGSH